ncbi:MAG: sulfatase [Gammaproteobacteria bacterium]|nr:sulfatase [Gammaproteobacteria bacterium]MBT8051077.1 sulfatase [Gammaproteobacteria bacterium]MBT8055875.1 sulfatase [Gammaproteobacteria bacterium]NNJ79136.1 sulfatase [Xanthomonadales bacterium]
MRKHRSTTPLTFALALAAMAFAATVAASPETDSRPNILIAITDDHSWKHTSAHGSTFIETPNIDRIGQSGLHFENAYSGSPGCSPSRAALLTGQHHWMIGPAGTHASTFPIHYDTFVDALDEAGYTVGFTGKGWGPGDWLSGGRQRNPAGDEYNEIKLDGEQAAGLSDIDYAANFEQFLAGRAKDDPFYFWVGAHEPHLPYAEGPQSADDLAKVEVPAFMPDTEASRSMLLDYGDEIEHFDRHLGRILEALEKAGELDNTLIIFTADNGMPMARAKANGYDYGVHVPLAIRWDRLGRTGHAVKAPVGFTDLSATVLDAAGLPVPPPYVGQSLLPLILGKKEDLEYQRAVFSGRERHSSSRYRNLAYPQRIMRRGDYLLIWSPKPDRYPAGAPRRIDDGVLSPPHSAYHDIDDSVNKRELLAGRDDPYLGRFFHLAVDKQPEWQLFNVIEDPDCLNDLASDPDHSALLETFQQQLGATLKETGDPRVLGYGDVWEDHPRQRGPMRYFPKPE